MASRSEIQALLTGPGGMFEVVTEKVDGIDMLVYKNRLGSLREVAAIGQGRGDTEEYLVHGDDRYGFGRFVSLANSVSSTLVESAGVGHGDRVAILSANNPEWCLAFWGTVDIGAVCVGLNGWWKADEILYALRDSASRVLIADGPRFERIAARLAEAPALETVFLIDADADAYASPGSGDPRPRLLPFSELLARPASDLPASPIAEGDPAVIFYTSGTTGRPKGAISTHRSMIANLQNTVYNAAAGALLAADGPAADGSPDDVKATSRLRPEVGAQTTGLLTSPLFHVSGCHSVLVVGMLAGLRIVMPTGRFDPAKAMALIERERVSVWATVPTMVWRVVEHPDVGRHDLSSVTQVVCGGSASAQELQRRIQATFPSVKTIGNAYGLTESSSAVTVNSGQDFLDRPDSVGLPLPTVELKIVDGEIWIKGPQIMPGYWGQPDASKAVLTDGWLHSGDVGYLDEDGFLYITDRAKDMIIRGGENVYCTEIENRLVEHPEVRDAAVIGVPHPTLGEEVKAIIEVEPGSKLGVADVQAWVAETLADFKVPAHVEFRTDRLPRNASGKLLKNALRGKDAVNFAETL